MFNYGTNQIKFEISPVNFRRIQLLSFVIDFLLSNIDFSLQLEC